MSFQTYDFISFTPEIPSGYPIGGTRSFSLVLIAGQGTKDTSKPSNKPN